MMALAFCVAFESMTLPVTAATVIVTAQSGIAENAAFTGQEEYKDFQQAASELKQKMLNRQRNISVKVKLGNNDISKELNRLLEAAYAEDSSNFAAGDYLRCSVIQIQASYQILQTQEDSTLYCTFILSCTYSSTLQQENYVTSQAKKLISSLKLNSLSDDEKIKAVYDYVTKTVDYDYAGVNEASSHSAYAALANKKAVCQGYSTLVYRLLCECGIQTRIITGKSQNQNHAWNIVRLNGQWYNLDATWDSNFDGNDQKYMYFLKGSSEFTDHVRDQEFQTAEFLAKYPMSAASYAKYQPAVTKVTGVKAASVTSNSVTLTWNAQAKAECYYVCNLVDGKYLTSSKWKATQNSLKITTDYCGKKLESGKSYTYGIVAYNKKTGNTVVSDPITVTLKTVTKPAKTSITKLSSTSGKITATWKKVTSCNGYQVQYSTTKNFTSKTTNTIKISSAATLKTTIKSLKKGKTYYVRVRAWKKADGEMIYGSWSTVKGLKCK